MKIEIAAVGKLRDAHLRALTDEYVGRIGHYLPIEEREVREGKRMKHDVAAGKLEEAESLLGPIAPDAVVVAMDERGKTSDSAGFAEWMNGQMVSGVRHVSFVVGGAFGLDPTVRRRAQRVIALSKMTFPHEVARMLLAEQIYRAMSIIRGEPYHK